MKQLVQNQAQEEAQSLVEDIQHHYRTIEQKNLGHVRGFFQESLDALKEQVEEHRLALQYLADEAPEGQEELQGLIEGFGNAYTEVEDALEQARGIVAETAGSQHQSRGEDAQEKDESEEHESEEKQEAFGDGEAQGRENSASEESEGAEAESGVTKAARQRAQELGLDLSQVKGTGASGSVTIEDVEQAALEIIQAGEEES